MFSWRPEHIIDLDGIVVVVNASNLLPALTVAQLCDIFAGRITHWNSVGGTPDRITVLALDDKSRAYDTFRSLVLGKAAVLGDARRFEDSTALSAAVAMDPHAIGFIGLPFLKETKALRITSAGPIAPTAVASATPRGPLLGRLAGQTIVDNGGSVGTPHARSLPPGFDMDAFVQRAVANLRAGYLTFNPPSEMRVGEPQEMEVVVSRDVHDKSAQALQGGRLATTVSLKIASAMTAELIADAQAFCISPLQSVAQPISFGTDGKICWAWRVTPLKSGQDMEMELVVQVVLEVINGSARRIINVITQDIILRVNAKTLLAHV